MVLVTGALVPIAGAQGGNEKPEATEIGVTAKEIRIAVLADVDTPVGAWTVPGLRGRGRGFAKYINKLGGSRTARSSSTSSTRS